MEDSDTWSSILLLLLFLVGGAYFASSEISFASLDMFRVKERAEKGDKKAKNALYIVENFDKALTTILIGNNISHIGFASVATAMAAKNFGVVAVPFVTILSTLIIFFFSEMLPKSYAKGSFQYALNTSSLLKFLMTVFTPLNYIFAQISSFVYRLFSKEDEPDITEEEFLTIVETVNDEGFLGEQKQRLLNSAIGFDNLRVQDAYQPLENLDMINIDSDLDEIFRQVKNSKYSRLPIYKKEKNRIVGVLSAKSFMKHYIQGEEINLRNMGSNLRYTRFDMPIDDLLRIMSAQRNHLYIVRDDTRRIRGIISLEDILEELVGEIWDENDLTDTRSLVEGEVR